MIIQIWEKSSYMYIAKKNYTIILLVQQINQKTNQMFVRISALASKKGQIKKK